MSRSRLEALEAMRRTRPDDPRILFALAAEYEKLERWDAMVPLLRDYLARADDEGNAWGRLGNALLRLGLIDEARDAYRSGIEAANRHGHPGMAAEFEEILGGI